MNRIAVQGEWVTAPAGPGRIDWHAALTIVLGAGATREDAFAQIRAIPTWNADAPIELHCSISGKTLTAPTLEDLPTENVSCCPPDGPGGEGWLLFYEYLDAQE